MVPGSGHSLCRLVGRQTRSATNSVGEHSEGQQTNCGQRRTPAGCVRGTGGVCAGSEGGHDCASFACSVTRSTTVEFQHNDIMMKTTVQNDLRHEMALESMWIVCAHEKSNN